MTLGTHTSNRRQFLQHTAVFVAGLPVLLLAGCGNGSSTKSPTSPAGQQATPPTVAMSPMAGMSHPATVESSTPTVTATKESQSTPTAISPASPSASMEAQGSPEAAGMEIKIVEPSIDYRTWGYDPQEAEVPVGTTITWLNTGGASHTVTTADGSSFDSGSIAPDGNFSHTMDTIGTYEYYCSLHPWMKATVTVVK